MHNEEQDVEAGLDEIGLFTTIVTESTEYTGIIDFETNKQIIFFDFTKNSDPSLTTIVIIWRLYYDRMRFSIFMSTIFPSFIVDQPICLNKKSIKNRQTLSYKIPEPQKIVSKIKKPTE